MTSWFEVDVSAHLHRHRVSAVCLFHEDSSISASCKVVQSKDEFGGAPHHGETLEPCWQRIGSIRYPNGNKLSFVVCLVKDKKSGKGKAIIINHLINDYQGF